MAEIHFINEPITRKQLKEIADERFGDLVKAVIDVEQEVMAVGGELHADEEVFLYENYGSKHKDAWGINLYPDKLIDDMIEFDSVINIKPSLGNRSRDVGDEATRNKIKNIVGKLIKEI